MKRTQIYLDTQQDARLDERARSVGTTKSALIREAINAYLDDGTAIESDGLARFRVAAAAAHGVAPYLPSGEEYVEQMRAADAEREGELRDRRSR